MKKIAIAALGLAAAAPAYAHPGHLAEEGFGHDHWLALAALAAIAVLVGGVVLARRLRARRAREA